MFCFKEFEEFIFLVYIFLPSLSVSYKRSLLSKQIQ